MNIDQQKNDSRISFGQCRTHDNSSRLCASILFWATLLAFMPEPSSAITLVSDHDTMVDNAKPTTQFGASGTLGIRNMGSTQQTFVKFDLTVLPQDAVITQATLRVYVNRVTVPGALIVNKVSGDWSEQALTQDTAATLMLTANTPLAIAATDKGQYVNYDITAWVQDWQVNPNSNFGIALTPASGTQINIALDSKESKGTSHPLEVEVALEGPRGAKGVKGDPGGQGLKGDTGDAGPQGPVGEQGSAGANGKDGAPGEQGLQGPPGAPGTTGPQGIPGAQGPKGFIGDTGTIGIDAITGYEKVTASHYGPRFTSSKVEAYCPLGKKVLGGGCSLNGDGIFSGGLPKVNNDGSYSFACIHPRNAQAQFFYAYAICAYAR
jgi:hypothetical protein